MLLKVRLLNLYTIIASVLRNLGKRVLVLWDLGKRNIADLQLFEGI